jgi:hypothetical protein
MYSLNPRALVTKFSTCFSDILASVFHFFWGGASSGIEWSSLPFDCLTISTEQREVIMVLAGAGAEADAEAQIS